MIYQLGAICSASLSVASNKLYEAGQKLNNEIKISNENEEKFHALQFVLKKYDEIRLEAAETDIARDITYLNIKCGEKILNFADLLRKFKEESTPISTSLNDQKRALTNYAECFTILTRDPINMHLEDAAFFLENFHQKVLNGSTHFALAPEANFCGGAIGRAEGSLEIFIEMNNENRIENFSVKKTFRVKPEQDSDEVTNWLTITDKVKMADGQVSALLSILDSRSPMILPPELDQRNWLQKFFDKILNLIPETLRFRATDLTPPPGADLRVAEPDYYDGDDSAQMSIIRDHSLDTPKSQIERNEELELAKSKGPDPSSRPL